MSGGERPLSHVCLCSFPVQCSGFRADGTGPLFRVLSGTDILASVTVSAATRFNVAIEGEKEQGVAHTYGTVRLILGLGGKA